MAAAAEGLNRGQVLGLVAMSVAVLVVANDFTALSVAIPAIEQTFGVGLDTAQWVINGYAMVFGVLIVTGGRLADMFGRRRMFMVGATIFAAFSVIGGLAPDIWVLLGARFLMGIGGALMWPAILGMTFDLLPPSRAGLAGGIILGAAGFGNAVGPLLGGVLTDTVGWRWVFFLNLPVAALAMLITFRVVGPDTPDSAGQRIDYPGIAALSIGILSLLYALDEGAARGWTDPLILGLFGLGAVGLVAFAFIGRRAGEAALVPSDVLRNRQFAAASVATLMMSAIFFSALVFLPQFMAKQLGFSAIGSGAGLLPMMGVFAVTSFIAGPLYNRLGPKIVVAAGAICLATGIFMLSLITAGTTFRELVPGMMVLGVGVGLFYSSVTTAGITALDKSKSSLAGAIIYMAQIAGGSIGLGLNTALVVTAPSLPEGIAIAFKVNAGLALAGLAIVVLFIGSKVDRARLSSLIHHHRAHA
ncbi:MAG: DHA2 family efflux MFS transporter permease subunit [Rhizobiales bacterium]|nr:DHA2 family efflux MFS transporter permease subunit [Hyphomicrobiales bacterium]